MTDDSYQEIAALRSRVAELEAKLKTQIEDGPWQAAVRNFGSPIWFVDGPDGPTLQVIRYSDLEQAEAMARRTAAALNRGNDMATITLTIDDSSVKPQYDEDSKVSDLILGASALLDDASRQVEDEETSCRLEKMAKDISDILGKANREELPVA